MSATQKFLKTCIKISYTTFIDFQDTEILDSLKTVKVDGPKTSSHKVKKLCTAIALFKLSFSHCIYFQGPLSSRQKHS